MPAYSDTLIHVTALYERLEEVMKLRGLNPSSWASAAKVTRATVRLAIAEKRDSMETRTLIALARAADVSFEWLATGGFGPDIPEDHRYPSRPRALAAAYIVGYSRETIAAIAGVDSLETDPGVDYWMTVLRAKHLEEAQSVRLLPAKPDELSS